MAERLPACDTLHPGEPGKVISVRCFRVDETPYMRSVCLKCKWVRNQDTQRRKRLGARAAAPSREPYGVARLDWLDTAPGVPYAYVGGLELGEFTQRQ